MHLKQFTVFQLKNIQHLHPHGDKPSTQAEVRLCPLRPYTCKIRIKLRVISANHSNLKVHNLNIELYQGPALRFRLLIGHRCAGAWNIRISDQSKNICKQALIFHYCGTVKLRFLLSCNKCSDSCKPRFSGRFL